MEQDQQQAYDRGSTIFSPDGRLYQVEYAREAVKRGTTSVGVTTTDGIVLAAERRLRSPLIEPESIEKIHDVDEHMAVASAGHVADARHLVDVARRSAQRNRYAYEEPMGPETLTDTLTDYVQEFTQRAGTRPFGVALLIAGVVDGESQLFEIDPSGTTSEWQAIAIGSSAQDTRSFLETEYDEGIDEDDGIDLALRALAESADELRPELVDAATIDAAEAEVAAIEDDRLQSHLDDVEV